MGARLARSHLQLEEGLTVRKNALLVLALALCLGCSSVSGPDLRMAEGIVEEVEHTGRGTGHESVRLRFADGTELVLRIRPGQVRKFRRFADYRVVYDDNGWLVAAEDTSADGKHWVEEYPGK